MEEMSENKLEIRGMPESPEKYEELLKAETKKRLDELIQSGVIPIPVSTLGIPKYSFTFYYQDLGNIAKCPKSEEAVKEPYETAMEGFRRLENYLDIDNLDEEILPVLDIRMEIPRCRSDFFLPKYDKITLDNRVVIRPFVSEKGFHVVGEMTIERAKLPFEYNVTFPLRSKSMTHYNLAPFKVPGEEAYETLVGVDRFPVLFPINLQGIYKTSFLAISLLYPKVLP
jgi:hypothetical protein